jgi:hypothetical protein
MGDFPTRQDLFRVARDEILTLNSKLSLDSVERDGSDANVLVNSDTAIGEEIVGQLIDVAAGQFLDSASGAALDRLVFDRYGILRKQAAPALATAEFNTTVANPTAFVIPVGTRVQTPDGIEFITTLASSFPAGITGTIFVPIRSVLAGADQQIKIGALTSIVSTVSGSPSDLTVTNTRASAGAADEETDDQLRDRARRFFTTARRGTLGALEAGALDTAGVVRATAIEVLDTFGRPGRYVQLVIADQFTDALATIGETTPAYDVQSQQLAQLVFNDLSDVRGAGIFVEVFVAQVILQSVQLNLTFAAGSDSDEVAIRARARIVNLINELDPGDPFDPDDAVDALRSVNGLIVTGSEIASPAGVVQPNAVQVLRSTLEIVAASAAEGTTPLAFTSNPDEIQATGQAGF